MRTVGLLIASAALARAQEYNGNISPPPPHPPGYGIDWNTASCRARVIPQTSGEIVNQWGLGDGTFTYYITFEIPDWLEGQEIAVELGSKTTGIQGTCSGALQGSQPYVEIGTGTLRFSLGAQTDGQHANQVGCQMIGEYEDATITYHGTHCYRSPPPPPHVHSVCAALIANSFVFRTYDQRDTGWKGVLHLGTWVPGLVLRIDFNGQPFKVLSAQYAELGGECTDTFCDFVLGNAGNTEHINTQAGQMTLTGGTFNFVADPAPPVTPDNQPRITCDYDIDAPAPPLRPPPPASPSPPPHPPPRPSPPPPPPPSPPPPHPKFPPWAVLDAADNIDVDSLRTDAEKVNVLLRQAVAQATRLLYNATEWSKRASARKEETGIELQEAHVSLQEAEEEVARMDKQQFSEEQARAHNDKAQAGREVEAARVSDEHATNALEQSNTAVSECLSLLDSIHRIQGKQPRVSLEALVKEASTIFTQLAVRLPEEYQDDDPVDGEGDGDDSYAYYEDDLAPPTPPPALLIVQHQSASPPPPPSPAARASRPLNLALRGTRAHPEQHLAACSNAPPPCPPLHGSRRHPQGVAGHGRGAGRSAGAADHQAPRLRPRGKPIRLLAPTHAPTHPHTHRHRHHHRHHHRHPHHPPHSRTPCTVTGGLGRPPAPMHLRALLLPPPHGPHRRGGERVRPAVR
jgi:hypothetical protein